MGSVTRDEAVCALLKQSIVELCKSSFAYEGLEVELDGILCITKKWNTGVENVVVKIHDLLWSETAAISSCFDFQNRMASKAPVKMSPIPDVGLLGRKGRLDNKRKAPDSPLSVHKNEMSSSNKISRSLECETGVNKTSDVNANKAGYIEISPVEPMAAETPALPQTSVSPMNNTEDQVKVTENETEHSASSQQLAAKAKHRKTGLHAIVSTLSENAQPVQVTSTGKEKGAPLEQTGHPVSEEQECVGSSTSSYSSAQIDQDLQSVEDEEATIFICEVCKLCLGSKAEYTAHVVQCRRNTTSDRHVCGLCDREFVDFNSLSLHCRIHSVNAVDKRESVWKGKPLTCGICRIVLRSKRNLQEHMREHSSGNEVVPFSCITCDYVYPEFTSFRRHRLDLHNSANNCRCEQCDLFFTFKEFKTHEMECSNHRRLSMLSDVTREADDSSKAADNNIKPVLPALDWLGMTTKEGTPLRELNQTTHFDDMGNEASNSMDCSDNLSIDESFSGADQSILTPHRSGTPQDVDAACQGPYRCQSCFTVFEVFREYASHNQEYHCRFVCSYCALSFASRRNLTRHMRRHTGMKPYQCPACVNSYTRDDDLKKHMKRVHDIQMMPKLRLPQGIKMSPTPPSE